MNESDYRDEIRKRYPLNGIGTRWEHYTELRDVFLSGIEVIENSLKTYPSEAYKEKLLKLKHAVETLDNRLAVLSGFDKASEFHSGFAQDLRLLHVQAKGQTQPWTKEIHPEREIAQLPAVSDTTRKACEEELRKAAEEGYVIPTKDISKDSPKKDSTGEADDAQAVS